MKTAHDPRHQLRIQRVSALFSYSFDSDQIEGIEDIVPYVESLDKKIAQFATERPLDDISKLDLAILREGVFELVYQNQNPSIIIDEAVEIAKSYGTDASPKFIHAILSKIAKET